MATVLISKFSTRIKPEVPGAPAELIRQAVIDATTEFCTRTRVWNEIQDSFLLSVASNDYELDTSCDVLALNIEDVWSGDRRLAPMNIEQLEFVMPDWQTATGPVPLYYNSEFNLDAFRVYPIPDTAATYLRIRGSFVPTEDAETLPEFFWARYRDAISSGAKALLMLKPGLTWSSPQLGGYHQERFDTAMADARIDIIHGRVSGTLTVQPRSFF